MAGTKILIVVVVLMLGATGLALAASGTQSNPGDTSSHAGGDATMEDVPSVDPAVSAGDEASASVAEYGDDESAEEKADSPDDESVDDQADSGSIDNESADGSAFAGNVSQGRQSTEDSASYTGSVAGQAQASEDSGPSESGDSKS